MQTERRLVPLSDGRVIDVLLAGPDNGIPLVINEGGPHALAGLLSDVDKAALTGEYASAVAGLGRGAVRHGRPANWVGWQRAVD